MKIVHLSTVHNARDPRILFNEAASLARVGHDVVFLVPSDAAGMMEGVTIYPLPRYSQRLRRMLFSLFGVWSRVLALKPDVIHFHDPELLPGAAFVRLLGIKVIYDVHEELRKDILLKAYLPKAIRSTLSTLVGAVEKLFARCMTAIVAATPKIAAQFSSQCTVVVQNFPDLQRDIFSFIADRFNQGSEFRCLYIGSISKERGITELLSALEVINQYRAVRLDLAGKFQSREDERDGYAHPGWRYVDYHGWLDGSALKDVCRRAQVGMVNLHKTESHLHAYPIKLFEYMAMGIPSIVSDIPLWRSIVEEARAGLVVDPKNPLEIANALGRLAESHALTAELGANGRRAAEERYNWSAESRKLVALYERVETGRLIDDFN